MSRKKQVYEKITALYCRISLDDGGDNESMSISNQKLMLRDFAEKHGMFQYEYYVDDGYTGRNFNRPSFQRMIADIEAGKVGCVVTKDLSRLGRNYIEAGSYIEIFFPKHNVRYIAVTDGVDSLTRQEMDITPFKNILNDMYSRDISKKVLAGITTRSRQGKFCGGTPPFGLMRDPEDKGHLILDPETAPIIRKIYDLSLIHIWELCPQQEKALEELGIPLPNPEKPKGRNNNRKQTFDAVCRTILFDIARRHGLHLDQEPSYGGRDYLEKQDYILMKQKEQLAAQEQKLEELTLKIEDVETLLDDVSDVAYDKAVEVVTDTVRQETHKEDIRLIEETKKWVLSPERKAPKKERDYAAARLDGVITKIKRVMQNALAKIQKTLMQPEVKKAGKEKIKEKARESILEKLSKGKVDADRDNRERWEREGRIVPNKKHDMEL